MSELRIDEGAGYRVYYTRRGKEIILLLLGGDKSSQSQDILDAQNLVKQLDEEEKAASKQTKGAGKAKGKRAET